MKKQLHKYKDILVILAIFALLLNIPTGEGKHLYTINKGLDLVISVLVLLLSGMIYALICMFTAIIFSDKYKSTSYSSPYPAVMNLFSRKYYSVYKEELVFYTVLDKENNYVEVYIPKLFTMVKLGYVQYTENEVVYKERLKEILEKFISVDINNRLSKRKHKAMFNKFNNLD